jgi:hypothetical protein
VGRREGRRGYERPCDRDVAGGSETLSLAARKRSQTPAHVSASFGVVHATAFPHAQEETMNRASRTTRDVAARHRPAPSRERRDDREQCEAVAEAILRRSRIRGLAQEALEILDGRKVA